MIAASFGDHSEGSRHHILRGTLAKAQELNIKISAAICDPGGRPIALQRMENTMWASAYAAQGKAVVSVAFGRPSGEMAERADKPACADLPWRRVVT